MSSHFTETPTTSSSSRSIDLSTSMVPPTLPSHQQQSFIPGPVPFPIPVAAPQPYPIAQPPVTNTATVMPIPVPVPPPAPTAETMLSDHYMMLDYLGIKRKKHVYVSHDESPIQEPPVCGLEAIKTYYPTEEEFIDPYKYLDSIHAENAHIGAVKIVPPFTFNPDLALDLGKFKFCAVKQNLKTSSLDNEEKVKLYRDLLKFHHDNGTPIYRLPSIDKKVVDLFKLRNSVRSKGGFESVCKKKLWAQIGRELGYTGRIMTSLSSSLKLSYTRILLKFEKHMLEKEEADKVKSESTSSDIPNDDNKRALEDSSRSESVPKKQKFLLETPFIVNSRQLFHRPKDILKAKGFKTNFDSFTESRQGITHSDSSTYPFYDANYWHKGLEILDKPYPGIDMTRSYSFAQFYDIHYKNNKALLDSAKGNDAMLVEEFWRIMDDNDPFNVETARFLPSSIYGSGFPTFTTPGAKKEDVSSPWNLHNLPLSEHGVLRYLNSDNDSISKTMMTVSMLHSVSAWGVEDHFLFAADYHHLGSNKMWYFIAPESREKFEEIVAKKVEERKAQSENQISIEEYSNEPIMVDVFEGLKQDGNGKRFEATNPKFEKLYDHNMTPQPLHINSNLFIKPSVLKEEGINVRYIIQKPGEFIFKFPETYTSTVSLGGSLTESVNFAPLDWLNHAMRSHEWYSKNLILPNFSYFQLLVNIIEDSKDANLLKMVEKDFFQFVENELTKRSELRANISHLRTISNKFDYICDDTLKHEFPTKLVITDGGDGFIIDSSRFLNNLNNNKFADDYFKEFSKFEMHVYYSDDKLKSLSKTLVTFSQTPEDWLKRYRETLGLDLKAGEPFEKPLLKNLRLLIADSERIDGDISEANFLKDYLDKKSVWVERAQEILAAKQASRTRNRKQTTRAAINSSADSNDDEHQTQKEKSQLEELVENIPELQFQTPEFDQIMDLVEEISEYTNNITSFLKEDHTMEEFSDMIEVGKSYGIKLKSVDALERVVARNKLIERYSRLSQNSQPGMKLLSNYVRLLNDAYDVCSNEDEDMIKSLQDQVKIGKYFTLRIHHELSNRSTLSIYKVDELLKAVKEYPIEPETVEMLEALKNGHSEAIAAKQAVTERIKTFNKSHEFFLKERALKNSGCPYDTLVYDSFLKTVIGDANDVRASYSEVREIMDRYAELLQKTETPGPLEHYLKMVEFWLRTCKKLFGKSNAPFSVLKGHLELLLEKILYAFNLQDVWVADLPEELHLTYCICRRPESGVMIACEKCNEWYHCKCLKLGRGKTKDVENFICPVCDYRVEVPREYHCPKVEELERLLDEGTALELRPDELGLVRQIYQSAVDFREYLKTALVRDTAGKISPEVPLEQLKFLMRKLEGSSVMLAEEYNELRQLIWQRDPCCSETPPLIENSMKTKKLRKKREDGVEEGTPGPTASPTDLAVASLAAFSGHDGFEDTEPECDGDGEIEPKERVSSITEAAVNP